MNNAAAVDTSKTYKTSRGWKVYPGAKYRFTQISGHVHVDEIVSYAGTEVYLGYITGEV